MRLASVVFFGVLLLSAVAKADVDDRCESTEIYDDIGDKFSLGGVLMGSDRSALPATARKVPDECPDEQGEAPDSCAYADDTDLSYVVRGHQIWEKEVPDLFSFGGHVIADIDAGDSVLEVFHKLEKLPKDFPRWHYRRLSKGFAFVTQACLRNSNGTIWDYQLVFNEFGQIISVVSASQAYWDVYRATQ